MLPLFPRLGVIRLRAVIFHLRDRPIPYLIYFSSTSIISPYMFPLSPRLGVIRLRTVIFHPRDRLLPFSYNAPTQPDCYPEQYFTSPERRRKRIRPLPARRPSDVGHRP